MKRAIVAVLLSACGAAPHTAATRAEAPASVASSAAGKKQAMPLIFLGDIEVRSTLGDQLPAKLERDHPVTITLRPSRPDPAAWEEITKRTRASPAPSGTLTFEYKGYLESNDAATAAHRQASFVIDFDEASVQAVHAEAQRANETPSMPSLAAFVDKFIDQKDMQRSFDVASRVASHKEGDCTEHAVLLAALGRSFGYATRVVLGVAIVVVEKQVVAVGHAWVEYFQGKTWHLADAAMPAELAARYIPLEVMNDEGPAFARRMNDASGLFLLREIEIEDARQ